MTTKFMLNKTEGHISYAAGSKYSLVDGFMFVLPNISLVKTDLSFLFSSTRVDSKLRHVGGREFVMII
jgi:hypothetical protein